MRPNVAVTEFLYAHDHAPKSHRWCASMMGALPKTAPNSELSPLHLIDCLL